MTEAKIDPSVKYREESPKESRQWSDHYILFIEDVTVVYDGFKALDIPALGIGHNELRVVIGPNGAGKTTFCDVVSGKTLPTTGDVYFDGEKITHHQEVDIARRGIRRKFQTPTVFDSLTTYQNMELALPGHQSLWANLSKKPRQKERDRILPILDRVNLIEELDTPAMYLSHGQRQWLAISTLVLASPKLLLIDEPAAGLTDADTELTGELLLELKKDHTIVVIEHDMDFVRQLNSKVTVLNEGAVMAEGNMEEVQSNPEVIEAYLGR